MPYWLGINQGSNDMTTAYRTPDHLAHLLGRNAWLNDGNETHVGTISSIWRGLATCEREGIVRHVALWQCIVEEPLDA